MRIAVTGAQGYIGGWLVPALAVRGHEVHGQDFAPGADARFDLHDTGARQAWLDAARPDLVIHLAALYGRVWGEQDLARTARDNAGLTAALARDTAGAGARLMYASSSEVYGMAAASGALATEASPLEPLNMYGATKKWGEEACRLYAPDGLVIARLNMPYGPACVPPEPGAVPHHSGRAGPCGYNALHTMLWQAHHGLDITVHAGTERCFTWIGDAIAGLVLAAESGQAGCWNVCRNDDHVSMAWLAERCIAEVPGWGATITETDPPAGVTPRKDLDDTALRALGWVPQVNLDEGLPATLEYMSQFGRDGKRAG
jgi:nucleoside-diphosphate-sugar epimerase